MASSNDGNSIIISWDNFKKMPNEAIEEFKILRVTYKKTKHDHHYITENFYRDNEKWYEENNTWNTTTDELKSLNGLQVWVKIEEFIK